jgi:hypothetical protein
MIIFHPALVAIIAHFFVLLFYENILISHLYIALIFIIFFLSSVFFHKYLKKFRASGVLLLQGMYWRFYSLIVLASSIVEYSYFGLPVFGDILYVKFGFPFLHHIVVSSWAIIFIKFKSKYTFYLMLLFSILNPILILNRDLLMITFFMIVVRFWLSGHVNKKIFFIAALLAVTVFSILGEIRSPNALNAINLPFSFEMDGLTNYLAWPVIYFTASTFNMINNIDFLSYDLYSPLITTFPEYYKFIIQFGSFGIVVYAFLLMIPVFYSKILRNYEQRAFLLFLYYQLIAGVLFSSKLFNTHLIFISILFFLMSYSPILLKNKISIKNPSKLH